MITRIPAEERFSRDYGFLKTHWLFSFSEYYDPQNMGFGPLRVFNDDIVMPGGGFPDHPHDTMEIVTIVHTGELTHTDSMGNKAVITPGMVQRMSAGEGVVHSEFNYGTEPCHLYQLWFFPNTTTDASYEEKALPAPGSGLTVLASDGGREGGITLRADATIRMLQLSGGEITHSLGDATGCFIYVMAGALSINGDVFEAGDQARIIDEGTLKFETSEGAHALVIDVQIK